MKPIYLDNSATTAVCPEAFKRVCDLTENCFGNPSSLHSLGQEALDVVTNARKTFAKSLSASTDEVFFTSCGSESNNTAIIGSASALKRRGNRIITSAVEHHSVLNTFKFLEEQGFDVVYLPVLRDGTVDVAEFEGAINEKTVLASIMMINNETGSVNPVKELAEVFHKKCPEGNFHCDCVQSYGKAEIKPRQMGIDLLSVSGHKIHAPKGIGGLYVKKGTKILPLINGGGQESGMRSGTESVPLIGGFEEAIKNAFSKDLTACREIVQGLKEYIISDLLTVDGIKINSPVNATPYILNISVEGIPSEVMIRYLETKNVFVSGGSACAKGHKSHVLTAMGVDSKDINCAVRISFCKENTLNDVTALCEGIKSACNELVRKGMKKR